MTKTLTLRSLLGTALVALALFLFTGVAGAQDYTEQPPSSVLSAGVEQGGDPGSVSNASASNDDGALPVTGSDLVTLGVLGAGLVVVGGVALTARRRATA